MKASRRLFLSQLIALPAAAKAGGLSMLAGETTSKLDMLGPELTCEIDTDGTCCIAIEQRPAPVATTATNRTEGHYPTRGGWWSVNGYWNTDRDYVLSHLLNSRNHRGTFDGSWLKSLDRAELHSLHSDHHEGRVKRIYIGCRKTVSEDREAVKRFLNVKQRPQRRRRAACPT